MNKKFFFNLQHWAMQRCNPPNGSNYKKKGANLTVFAFFFIITYVQKPIN